MIIIFLIIISMLVAYHIGEKRKIGFFWTLFFSIMFSPLVGIIIALSSKKIFPEHQLMVNAEKPLFKTLRITLGLALILLSLIGVIGCFLAKKDGTDYTPVYFVLIGFAGSGVFTFLYRPTSQIPN